MYPRSRPVTVGWMLCLENEFKKVSYQEITQYLNAVKFKLVYLYILFSVVVIVTT